jgi:AcrR family transcriptional regulator
MPYAKDHKARTRQRIVRSAQRLFTAQGFGGTTIEAIMRECQLTRGGFYAHFRSKAQLYAEAIGHVHLAEPAVAPAAQADGRWLDELFEAFAVAPRSGDQGPWQLLATEVASASPEVRASYARLLERLAQQLHRGSGRSFGIDGDALAAAAMIVGALAVARSVDDRSFALRLTEACRQRAQALLGARGDAARQEFLWAVSAADLRAPPPPLH